MRRARRWPWKHSCVVGRRFGRLGPCWAHRRGREAVPVVRPEASRNVVVPLESVVAVPVVRPDPSRKVFVPLLSVVTVRVLRPLASRNVVEVCADAAVAKVRNTSATIFPARKITDGSDVFDTKLIGAACQ